MMLDWCLFWLACRDASVVRDVRFGGASKVGRRRWCLVPAGRARGLPRRWAGQSTTMSMLTTPEGVIVAALIALIVALNVMFRRRLRNR